MLARPTQISGAPTGCQEPYTERALSAPWGVPAWVNRECARDSAGKRVEEGESILPRVGGEGAWPCCKREGTWGEYSGQMLVGTGRAEETEVRLEWYVSALELDRPSPGGGRMAGGCNSSFPLPLPPPPCCSCAVVSETELAVHSSANCFDKRL